MGDLVIHPLTLAEAHVFVRDHHRHHRAAQGGLFAIGCAVGEAALVWICIRRKGNCDGNGWWNLRKDAPAYDAAGDCRIAMRYIWQ